jgi:predicted nucleotidyltransferase component of viral defense system
MTNILHKIWMNRVLTLITDTKELAETLRFKGGTCAAMRGFLDRFSVDLDFDIIASEKDLPKLRKICKSVFKKLHLQVKDESTNTLQFFLKYPAESRQRNTLKIDGLIPPPESNDYEMVYLSDIDRMVWCQTKETMVANKLVAPLDRFGKRGAIAGRDIYDIHVFLMRGFAYNSKVIIERRNQDLKDFFESLIQFIDKNVTMTIINQDLNPLLPIKEYRKIRKILKSETLMLLNSEFERINSL